jgi:hypothetical protein
LLTARRKSKPAATKPSPEQQNQSWAQQKPSPRQQKPNLHPHRVIAQKIGFSIVYQKFLIRVLASTNFAAPRAAPPGPMVRAWHGNSDFRKDMFGAL